MRLFLIPDDPAANGEINRSQFAQRAWNREPTKKSHVN
jgi:hypothetical protein